MSVIDDAIQEGKFSEARRAHYKRLMAKDPRKTKKLIARLEPGLLPTPGDAALLAEAAEDEYEESQAAPVAAAPRAPAGPTAYPEEWMPPKVGGNVLNEEIDASKVQAHEMAIRNAGAAG